MAPGLREVSTIELPTGLSYSREQLPQISEKEMPKFIRACKKVGLLVEALKIKASKLKPSQSHLNMDKIQSMRESTKKRHPFLISEDNYIVDGHHGWGAALLEGDQKCTCVRVGLPIHKLIKLGNKYAGSTSKKLHEIGGFSLGLPGRSPFVGNPCKIPSCTNRANFQCMKCDKFICANHASNMTIDWQALCSKCKMANQLGSRGGWEMIAPKVRL